MFLFILYVYLAISGVVFAFGAFSVNGDRSATIGCTALSIHAFGILVYLIKVSFLG